MRRQRALCTGSNASRDPSAGEDGGANAQGPYIDFRRREMDDLEVPMEMYGGFAPTHDIQSFVDNFSHLEKGARVTETTVRVAGRVVSKRTAGKRTAFLDIEQGVDARGKAPKLQILVESSRLESPPFDQNYAIKVGDVIGVEGLPAKSGRGELSVVPRSLTVLAPCWHGLPGGLTDPESRYRSRHVDMLVNRNVVETFRARAQVLQSVRAFLTEQNFVEVETPILWGNHGGATARPFETQMHAMGGMPLRLRVAPELFLKQLIIGGIDRVFEIGKVFRNEGIDALHNPEFTTVEFYQAYADYQQLMDTTEALIRRVASDVRPGLIPTQTKDGKTVDIDFEKPFQRVEVVPALEEPIGRALPDLNSEESIPELIAICEDSGVRLPGSAVGAADTAGQIQPNLSQLVDKLVGHFVEPLCVQPTFLLHHPECLSPLAKTHPTQAPGGVTERFELFVAGRELCNAYSELNDPDEQRRRFALQDAARLAGDVESQPSDLDYCRALEYGLPPTGGWGMGVDRLVMLLTGSRHMREVLMFPLLRPDEGRPRRTVDDANSVDGSINTQ